MRLLVNIIFVLLIIAPKALFGQLFPSKNFTTSDGLANNAIRSMFIDNKNTLWIGTENGISIFENGQFTNLYKENGLAHNSCWDICQDLNSNMWFASYGGGVTKFDGKKYTSFSVHKGLANNKTRKVFSHKNKIIVGTEYGISIIDINTNHIVTPQEIFPQFGVFIVTAIFEHKEEIYFSALNEGFFKIINWDTNPKVVRVSEFQNSYSVGVFQNKLFNSNKGFIDIFEFRDGNPVYKKKFGKSIVWQYATDLQNNIYAASWGIFDNSGGLFTIKNDRMLNVSENFGIDSKSLLNVVYDKMNDFLYAGSKDKGFYQIQLDKSILYHPFQNQKVIGFEENLILHENGINFEIGKDKIKKITREHFNIFHKNFIAKNQIKLPTFEKGFFELNHSLKASKIEFYGLVKHKNSFFVNSNIGIFQINQKVEISNYIPIHTFKFGFTADDLFFETHPYGATNLYDDVYQLKIKAFSKEISDVVETINLDGTTYFLSVFNGLSYYKDGKFRSYLKEGIFKEEKLKHATSNSKGALIVSSEFGEVFIIEDLKSFEKVIKIAKAKIIGNSISFLESYKDVLFIGTEKGINIYRNGNIQLIDIEQGLSDCNFVSSKIIGNFLYTGTFKGYFKLNLNQLISDKKQVANLEISQILINNQPISRSQFEWYKFVGKKLKTAYDENTLSVDFVAKGAPFPQKLKYRYRLEASNQWSPYSEKTNIFLPYLPCGNYILEVEVYDLNSGRRKQFSLLELEISPPFYYRWWFLTLTFLTLLGITYGSIAQFKKKAKEKALIQKRIAETKLEALLSQMNPHFTFNAMNAIQNYIISNDTLNSLHYIGEFAKLMRKTLDNSSKPTISLTEEIDYLKTYISIENMRFNHRIEVEFIINSNVNLSSPIPTMLLQPFVENVFVHAFSNATENPKITVVFKMKTATTLQIKIIDNGKGIATSKSHLHQSKGILLAKERLSLLQNQIKEAIELQHNFPSGTIVLIEIQV